MTLGKYIKMPHCRILSRREIVIASLVGGTLLGTSSVAATSKSADKIAKESKASHPFEGEILGQGDFRYRAYRHWGLLDRKGYPVRDCHGITEDRDGRIVLLTNDTHNNLIAYSKAGEFISAWENRFPAAHGFEITDQQGEDRYWITDHDRQVVSMVTAEGREQRRLDPSAVASKYPDLIKYHPTNTAIMLDGDFFVSDGYGSSFIHHLDPDWRYISSFGGEGDGPAHLSGPHAVWIDTRSGKPQLLVCDRGHNLLTWFSPSGELLRIVELPNPSREPADGPMPSNVARFKGHRSDHLAVACLSGMILILDGRDRIVSVIGGEPPVYIDEKLQPIRPFNYTFNHPHDVHVDADGALYVAQFWSNQTYPIKLEPLSATG